MRDFSDIAIFERKFFYMSEEIEIKDEVLDLKVTDKYDENQIQVLTAEDLRREIGSPDEIARGFESRADLETLREKARKYKKTRMICWIALALTAAAIAAAIIVVKSNENYHSEIKSDSHIEEVES